MKLNNSKLSLFVVALNLFLNVSIVASIQDSIGIEKKDGKTFVLHQVDAKETLYSISKKYSTKVEEIKAANPEIGDGIKIGQTIRIPYKNTIQDAPAGTESKIIKTGKIHKVEPKETLFGIAKKYNVSVDDIKKANPELIDGLKTGMEIVIPADKTPVNTTTNPTNNVVVTKTKEDDKEPIVVPSQNQPKGEFKKVTEKGTAELLEESSTLAPKFQALHKTAPIGTIIQVDNDSNGQKIFVRVIGKLTDSSDDKVIIKISAKAMERLEVKDKKIAVTLTYIP